MVLCPPELILWAVRLLGLRLYLLVISFPVLSLITVLFCFVCLFLMLSLLAWCVEVECFCPRGRRR